MRHTGAATRRMSRRQEWPISSGGWCAPFRQNAPVVGGGQGAGGYEEERREHAEAEAADGEDDQPCQRLAAVDIDAPLHVLYPAGSSSDSAFELLQSQDRHPLMLGELNHFPATHFCIKPPYIIFDHGQHAGRVRGAIVAG